MGRDLTARDADRRSVGMIAPTEVKGAVHRHVVRDPTANPVVNPGARKTASLDATADVGRGVTWGASRGVGQDLGPATHDRPAVGVGGDGQDEPERGRRGLLDRDHQVRAQAGQERRREVVDETTGDALRRAQRREREARRKDMPVGLAE